MTVLTPTAQPATGWMPPIANPWTPVGMIKHYFHDDDIDFAQQHQVEIRAYCGVWEYPANDITNYFICPKCKEIKEQQ